MLPRISLLAVLLLAGCARAGEPEVQKDVVYGKTGDVELKMDLCVPASGEGPFPVVVCIHGGGWKGGNKAQYTSGIREFARQGYVAASVEYRFAPKYKFPAQVEDVKCAVRYLRSRAKELKIDTAKFAAMGDSAGGHLSLLLGTMDKKDGLEGDGGCAGQPSKVQCVVNYYGPADLCLEGSWSPFVTNLITDFLGTNDQKAPVFAQASPVTYVDKDDAPVLTFHGTVDPLVPLKQAERIHEVLKKAGVSEHLEVIENGGHGFKGEDFARTVKLTMEFLEKNLKGKK